MARYTIQFSVQKGNSSTVMTATVQADTEYVAIMLAEGQLRSRTRSQYMSHTWSLINITRH